MYTKKKQVSLEACTFDSVSITSPDLVLCNKRNILKLVLCLQREFEEKLATIEANISDLKNSLEAVQIRCSKA
jgi:hypothetical protein